LAAEQTEVQQKLDSFRTALTTFLKGAPDASQTIRDYLGDKYKSVIDLIDIIKALREMEETIRDTFKYGASDTQVIELPYIKPYLKKTETPETPETSEDEDVYKLIENIDNPITTLGGSSKIDSIAGILLNKLKTVNVNDLKEVVFQIPGILVKIIDEHKDTDKAGNDTFVKALNDTCVQIGTGCNGEGNEKTYGPYRKCSGSNC
jgi:hypothetical protein